MVAGELGVLLHEADKVSLHIDVALADNLSPMTDCEHVWMPNQKMDFPHTNLGLVSETSDLQGESR